MLHCFFNNNTLDLPSRVTDTAGLARLRGKGIFPLPPAVDGPRPPRGEVLRGQPLRLLQRGPGELCGSGGAESLCCV